MRLVLKDAASRFMDDVSETSFGELGPGTGSGNPGLINLKHLVIKDTYSNPFFERIAQYRASAS